MMQIPSPPHPSIDPGEWQLLLESKSEDNAVEPNNVAHVLRKVELSEEVLHVVEKALTAAGVSVSHVEPEIEPLPEKRMASRRSGESNDPMKMYLQEIGQVDLLTAEQERTLGRQIQEMLVAKKQLENRDLSVAEKRRLRGVVHTGDAAREHLITANLRLVVSIARRYDGKGLQLPDLIQEGNIGLMRAAEKYDWEKGFKFSTYATWWIRQAMMRAMADQGRTIRVPSHVVELLHRIAKAERELTVEMEREPTLDELAHRTMLEPERILELRQISSVTISLDAPVGSDDDSQTWSDRVSSDDEDDSPVEQVQRKMLMAAIVYELQALPERDRRILEKRFGIQNGKPQTLDDVAKEEGVTRERVRQIEQKTLARMRHPNNSRKLRSFLDDIG
jgi:RNA polymerase primary sigma factor